MGRLTKAVRAVAIASVLATSATVTATAAADFTPGAAGLGDPFFPDAGNGGYDAGSYDLALDYSPDTRELKGTATIRAVATQDLSSFDLDFRHLQVDALTVDGTAATFSRSGQELIVTPAAGITNGSEFTVVVSYSGQPQNVTDPDGSKDGWITTDDGAFVASEPQGAPSWFPCNDYPTDKATFSFEITVPRGVEAVANGALVSRQSAGDKVTWTYRADEPMATYLATSTIGQFRIDRKRIAGLPSLVAVDPRVAAGSRNALGKQGQMLKFERGLFGPYPFSQTGVIVDSAPDVGYALETQTRPLFDSAAGEITLAHELAHQWFGDSVSLQSWSDMWLNEGFATWAQWAWREHEGGPTTGERFRALKRVPASSRALWGFPPAVIPDAPDLFATPVYARGAMALEALRERIGTHDFLATLRTWESTYKYSHANTDDFIAIAGQQSGRQLDGLFQRWLYHSGKP
jgi:aminopeptidase N